MAEDDKSSSGSSGKGEPETSDSKEAKASPWPSARKSEAPPPNVAVNTPATDGRAAWAAPLHRFDRGWTRFEARLCAGVLIAEILSLVFWISMSALAQTGNDGPGRVFRCLVGAVVVGYVVHRLSKDHFRHEAMTATGAAIGLLLGMLLGDFGTTYFGNLLGWMQNASILTFFGGVSELAKRLTLWLALLGASVATAQGKHINVDVVMRLLGPRGRVPVAILGWLAAAVVCLAGVWGFFDHVAVEDYHAPTSTPCAGEAPKLCPAPPSSKVAFVWQHTGEDLFLASRQLSLDLRTLPKVLSGTPYGSTLTPHEWNEWVRGGGWENHFAAEAVKGMLLPEDSTDFRTPAVTAVPGGYERIFKILVRELNLVFAFGLLMIGLRFVLRSILAVTGWVKVDPDAAHSDEDLHAHGPMPVPGNEASS